MRALLPAVLLLALANCGASDGAANDARGETAVDKAALTRLSLTSDAFQGGQPIPAQYSCDGANRSPALSWSEPPPDTKSFALVIDDPDAPGGTFRHWGAYDIPATAHSIGAGQTLGAQAINDMGKAGYGGPCPPKGHGPHHYHFKLFALDVPDLGLHGEVKIGDLERETERHAVGRGELVGTYERR